MIIKGSVALITGGAQGLGRGFARALLQRGGKVAVVDLDKQKGEEFFAEIADEHSKDNCIFIPCDVTNTGQLTESFNTTKNTFGKLDIVCNNAGTADTSLDDLHVVALNLTALIHGTAEGIKHMSKKNGGGGGLIVNIASVAGIVPMSGSHIYTATKFGVVGFTRSFKKALIEDGIRVNCLCPSYVQTALVEKFMKTIESSGQKSLASTGGLLPMENVVDAFLELVHNDSYRGRVVQITPNTGTSMVQFQRPILEQMMKSNL